MKPNSSLSLSASSLAAAESLSLPRFQEVVLSSDVRCSGCQSRLADMISKMGADLESIVVSASDKKVTVICRYPSVAAAKVPGQLVLAVNRSPLHKFSLIKRILRTTSS